MQRHGGGIAAGQDQAGGGSPRRTDGAEDIGRSGALIVGSRWPRPAPCPPAGEFVLLADPGLVLKQIPIGLPAASRRAISSRPAAKFMEWPAPRAGGNMIAGLPGDEEQNMAVSVLGIDLGKNSCSLVGFDASGCVVVRRRMRRDAVLAFAAKLAPCVIAMEACCGAHHLGRELRAQGHEIRLMSPEYVRPYVKAQKNDDRDAEAIAEAATRPTMRFVELKSEAQLDMQSLHRARDRLIGERTALINQIRAFLLERGLIVPQGRRKLELYLEVLFAEERVPFSPRTRLLVDDMRAEWRAIDRRISTFDEEFTEQARTSDAARLLTTIPGIGALNATALQAAIGNAQTFGRGRDLAAWLGLVPKQMTTGGKPTLLGITKRGNVYLRKMLIHGARAALPTLSKSETPLGGWLRGLLARAHTNTVVVALAAKLARIAWAVLRSGKRFEMGAAMVS
jgi:transposase